MILGVHRAAMGYDKVDCTIKNNRLCLALVVFRIAVLAQAFDERWLTFHIRFKLTHRVSECPLSTKTRDSEHREAEPI
jgi:hypothetical protein